MRLAIATALAFVLCVTPAVARERVSAKRAAQVARASVIRDFSGFTEHQPRTHIRCHGGTTATCRVAYRGDRAHIRLTVLVWARPDTWGIRYANMRLVGDL